MILKTGLTSAILRAVGNPGVEIPQLKLLSTIGKSCFIVKNRFLLSLKRPAAQKTRKTTCIIKSNLSKATSFSPKTYYSAIKETFAVLVLSFFFNNITVAIFYEFFCVFDLLLAIVIKMILNIN